MLPFESVAMLWDVRKLTEAVPTMPAKESHYFHLPAVHDLYLLVAAIRIVEETLFFVR